MTTQIVIYGAGGFAREVAWLAESLNDSMQKTQVVCFVDDDVANHGKVLNTIPVMGLENAFQAFPDAKIVGGIGAPKVRETVMAKAKGWDLSLPP